MLNAILETSKVNLIMSLPNAKCISVCRNTTAIESAKHFSPSVRLVLSCGNTPKYFLPVTNFKTKNKPYCRTLYRVGQNSLSYVAFNGP